MQHQPKKLNKRSLLYKKLLSLGLITKSDWKRSTIAGMLQILKEHEE